MTTVADGFSRRDRAELGRWSACLALVLLMHVAAGLYLLWRQVPPDAGGQQPPAAVMIDLAPLPAPSLPQPAPPVPAPLEPEAKIPEVPPPPLPPEPDVKLPIVEPSPAPRPAVALPPKPPPTPKPRVEHPPEARPEQRPPPPAPAVSAAPVPPASAAPAANAGATRATWQTQVAAQLERYKRYPRLAQEQRQQGIAQLRFALDRQGHVLSAQIDRGSGFALLDEEVLALVQRAQPLPAPPPEVPGARIELTIPVQFSIRPGLR
jgi:periplasmic protein TonB